MLAEEGEAYSSSSFSLIGNDMSEEEGEEEEDEMGLPVARDAHGQRSVKYLVHLRYNDLLSTLPDAVTIRAAGG